jgi:hypothetical protein
VKDRFVVQTFDCNPAPAYHGIFDDDCKQYGMPERAVSMFFISKEDADKVCELINKEWNTFLRTGR